jgi:hypothetical protein
MKEWYISFGQVHRHVINGHVLDKDCLALIRAENWNEMRKKANRYFKGYFFTDYEADSFPWEDMMYFSRGVIDFEIYHDPVKFDFIDKKEENGR